MAQDIIPRPSDLRRRLSSLAPLVVLAWLVLAVAIGIFAWRVAERIVADQSERAEHARAAAAPGTFRPTPAQRAGLKLETVPTAFFRVSASPRATSRSTTV
jgi:hypothetical protein